MLWGSAELCDVGRGTGHVLPTAESPDNTESSGPSSQILEDIGRDKKSGAIVANVAGLVFTREDGRAITKDMIGMAVKKAARKGNIRDFRFHDYRHTALTDWARKNINVDVAMLAAGHESVQMHKRYVNLKNKDVAVAFGLATQWQHGNEPATSESVTS